MAIRIAINGFGRIGRMILRAIAERGLLGNVIDVAAIVDVSKEAEFYAYQLKYDSVHGRFPADIRTEDDHLIVNGHRIQCIPAPDQINDLPWKNLEIDYVIESTGRFTSRDMVQGHLDAGAKRVIISAPSTGGDVKTIVIGINDSEYNPSLHYVVSGASCTVNCILPLLRVLEDFGPGISSGHISVILPYTASRKIVDSYSERSWRDGRSAPTNIIPSTIKATAVIDELFPSLKGKIKDVVFRVPIACVSLVDFSFITERDSSIEEIDNALRDASETCLEGILGFTREQIVSKDILHDDRSSIYDSSLTLQYNLPDEKRFFRLFSWYDNEWGFSNRIVDIVRKLGRF